MEVDASSPPPRVVIFTLTNKVCLLSRIYTTKATSADVNIVCDDGVVGTHRAVMANLSKFLDRVLWCDMVNCTRLILPGVSKVEVELLLRLAYLGECFVTSTTRGQLSALMNRLSVSEKCMSEVKLEEEVVTSTDMRKYFCKYCGAAYRRRNKMKRHEDKCEERSIKVVTLYLLYC